MKNSFPVLSLLFLLVLTSCQPDNDDEIDCYSTGILHLVSSLEAEYGCSDTRYLSVALLEENTLVRSQPEFEALITDEFCKPEVDFTKYDLIIGKKQLTSGNTSIEYSFGYTCTRGKMLLQVIFLQNEAAVAPNITYHALIPKLKEGETVEVEIDVKMAGTTEQNN